MAFSYIICIFVPKIFKNKNIIYKQFMAIAIRSIPTLYGEDAEVFLKKAEETEKNNKRINISHNIKLVKEYLSKQNI